MPVVSGAARFFPLAEAEEIGIDGKGEGRGVEIGTPRDVSIAGNAEVLRDGSPITVAEDRDDDLPGREASGTAPDTSVD